MREQVTLEVGDVLFSEVGFGNRTLVKYTVNRVTTTQAIIGEGNRITRFDRVVCPNHFYPKGAYSYNQSHYTTATPELEQEYATQRTLYKLNNFSMQTLKPEALEGVLRIITAPSNIKEANNG